MNEDSVVILVDGVHHIFDGDELTSPEQQAIEFLTVRDEISRDF